MFRPRCTPRLRRTGAAGCAKCLGLLFIAAGVIAATPDVGRAALAKAAGGSGYSGTLSSNPAIRRQQLSCDPPPVEGSTSVQYPSATVTLVAARFGPGYGLPVDPADPGQVEVRDSEGVRSFVPLGQWLDPQRRPPFVTETGYVRVAYRLTGVPGRIPPDPGYTIVDQDRGVTKDEGVDTHALFFELKDPAAPLSTIASYHIFASDGTGGRPMDFLRDPNGGVRIPAASIASADVAGPFPEPSSLGLLAVGALGLLRRGRRR